MKSLDEYMDIVLDALKKEYLKDTSALWPYPCVAIIKKGEMKVIDGKYRDEELLAWLNYNLDLKNIEYIIVGRMVVKYFDIVNPQTGSKYIKEKAIMVMGKNMRNNRTKLIILPCKEHRDYRTPEQIEKNEIGIENPIKNPDISKPEFDEKGKYIDFLTAKFGEPTIYDSNKGDQFLIDPLIGAIGRIDKNIIEKATNIDPSNILKEGGHA